MVVNLMNNMKRKNLIKLFKTRKVVFNEYGQILYTISFSQKEVPIFMQCIIRKIA